LDPKATAVDAVGPSLDDSTWAESGLTVDHRSAGPFFGDSPVLDADLRKLRDSMNR
jgi:hypothetical protein